LIRRHFLGVFRFAQMALADARILTYTSNKEYHPIVKAQHADHRDGRNKPAMAK
jgi:hypothetical protein